MQQIMTPPGRRLTSRTFGYHTRVNKRLAHNSTRTTYVSEIIFLWVAVLHKMHMRRYAVNETRHWALNKLTEYHLILHITRTALQDPCHMKTFLTSHA